ncbi:MAG: MFS transporter [Anaerolineales bacterium]|nr:MFS transporter [Anaerolineales bacterium]
MSESEEKLDFKKILPIFIIVLVDLLGLTIIIPLLPLYATAFGAHAFMIGALGATYPIMQFMGAPLLGRLSDKYGRKPILIISQIGTLVGFLILGFANTLWLLFISRIIDGISGANIATAQAAISDSTTERTRTQGLGLIGAAFGLGFIIGPVIAFVALALSGNNYQVPAFAAAVFSAASILLTAFWFEETHPESARSDKVKGSAFSLTAMVQAVRHPAVGLLLLLIFAQQLAFGGFEQLLALFTLNRLGLNASGNAVVFVFVGIIIVAVQGGLIGRWSRAYGDRRLVYAGLALLAVGLTAVGLTPRQPVPWYSQTELTEELSISRSLPGETPPTQDVSIELPDDSNNGWLGLAWILIAMIPTGIGGGILQPAINSLITKRIAASDVGGMLGISSAFLSGANALAPLIGGAVFQAFGATAPFVVWGVFMGVLFVLAIKQIKPGREETAVSGLARGSGAH